MLERVTIETGRFREHPLCLPVNGRRVDVPIRPYTSQATPERVEYAGKYAGVVYCEATFPDEWLEYVQC
jgi:hypothetical protein